MSFWRYQALRTAVAFALFVATVPFAFLIVGLLGRGMPEAAAPVAFFGVGIIWLAGNVAACHLISEKLSKRWSRK